MRKMRAPVATAVAIAVGLIVLLGYFIPFSGILRQLRDVMLSWAIVLAGVAALVGIVNLVRAHWRKMTVRVERDPYSPLLILAFLATVGLGIAFGGPKSAAFQAAVNAVQVPVETALMAVLAISLGYAAVRLLQRRRGVMAVVFAVSTLLYLLLNSGVLAFNFNNALLQSLMDGLQQLPVAGARGILLGIALGSLTTGLRILMGVDRPYSG